MMTSKRNSLPKSINGTIYNDLAERMLKDVAEDFCKHCENPRREGKIVDLVNPLKCQCRCERVEGVLAAARVLRK